MDARNLAKRYDLPPVDWAGVQAALVAGPGQAPGDGGPNRHTWWLATINADGTPHVNGVGALWVDGALWFETGEHTRKGRNLARDPRCTASMALDDYDLVVGGRAQPVRDPDTVADMAQRWAAGGWPCQVDGSGTALTAPFSAPSAGAPPWLVYRMTVESATAPRDRARRRNLLAFRARGVTTMASEPLRLSQAAKRFGLTTRQVVQLVDDRRIPYVMTAKTGRKTAAGQKREPLLTCTFDWWSGRASIP